ncbi:MAG TPA: type II toxin-antitoxin system PemK/MazF family toxin [Thermoanaerobaculaceae bacterium]|nr:type II toxin-antitoxin system PemK/MazF family toxin [Thermoanaerobaculaceae bacterium]
MRRGEVWWASLPDPTGSGPGYRRPVVVVQANEFNESRIQTVVVAAITSKLALAGAPGNVLGKRRETGLPTDSVINVSQVLTLGRSFLTLKIKALPASLMRSVDAGLRLALGL